MLASMTASAQREAAGIPTQPPNGILIRIEELAINAVRCAERMPPEERESHLVGTLKHIQSVAETGVHR